MVGMIQIKNQAMASLFLWVVCFLEGGEFYFFPAWGLEVPACPCWHSSGGVEGELRARLQERHQESKYCR